MKTLLYSFLFLLLAVAAGILMRQNPAYLLITINHISVQTSLWLALFAVIIAIFLIREIVQLLRGIYRIPANIQHVFQRRKVSALQKLTEEGLCAFVEAYWEKSESHLYKAGKKSCRPFFYYMGAAQAAFEQKDIQSANAYWEKAREIVQPSEQLALEIAQIRWQLVLNNYQQALTQLQTLQTTYPKHPFVLNGLKETYLALGNWQELHELLPILEDIESDKMVHKQLEQRVLVALLDEAGRSKSLEALEQCWQKLSKKWRKNTALVERYAHYLIEQNQYEKTEDVLKKAIQLEKNAKFLMQYTQVSSEDPVKQLARAEIWLKEDPENAGLLFCVGSLCARHRLWGKAKTYLELSIKYDTANNPDVYLLLGNVLEALHDRQAALDCYKVGLEEQRNKTAI